MTKEASLARSDTSRLNKQGFIPLYYQIQQAVMQKIQMGELAIGDRIESEIELSRRYAVSRMTARQALHGLKTSGYATSHKGRGTFVSRPKLEKNILHLHGFSEEMRERGMTTKSRILEKTVVLPSEDLAQKLRLDGGDHVLRLRRLRLVDNMPIVIEVSNMPLSQFPGLDRYDFANQSLYHILRKQYGVRIGWADEVIEAVPATSEETRLLNVTRGSSILSITRLVMTTEEQPIEAACSRYRGDSYRASIRVDSTDANR